MVDHFPAAFVEHLARPRHLAPPGGPPWSASGVGVMEGPRIHTTLTVWVSLGEGPGRPVERLAWRGIGMPESVPAASAVACLVLERGMDATSAAALDLPAVAALLGGMPQGREDAALRVLQALRRALADAGALGEASPDHTLADAERLCHCMGVTWADLRAAAAADADRLNLQRRTGFGTGCGTCLHVISEALDQLELG